MTIGHPGFADPVLDSQACFRAVLDAMARPGQVHTVAAPHLPPPPLDRATAAVLLTLADAETPLWLDPAAEAARDWIAFHCGAPLAGAPEAALALVLGPVRLAGFGAGTDDAPERGATIILQVAAVGRGALGRGALGRGARFRLSGPGLAEPADLAVAGLAAGFAAEWAVNHALFPRGLDLILCAGDRLAALPRTVRIEAV